jgi:Flp pilus assembly protein TadD
MRLTEFHRTSRIAIAAFLLIGVAACAQGDLSGRNGDAAAGDKEVVAAMMRAGDAAAKRGDYGASAAFYRRAQNADPKAAEPLLGLGEALIAAGVTREAADAFRQAMSIDPNNPRALRGLGNALIGQDQSDLSIAEFEKALTVNPKDYRAYSGLGVAHDSMAEHTKAQEYYYAGLTIAPDDVTLRNNLGLSLAFAGHYKGAIEILRPLALRPGASARDRQNLALAYGLSGDVDQAKKFARMDMDSREVERNLSYYAALRSIADPVMRVKSVRAGYALQVP